MHLSAEDRKKLVVLGLVGLLFALALALLLNQSKRVQRRADFAQLWFAGRNLLREGRNLYSPQNGFELIEFTGIETNPYEGNFYYPAPLFVLYSPLARLPLGTAHFIWVVFIQLAFFAGLWLLIRAAGWPKDANQITLLLVLATLFIPHLQNTIFGQVNTLGVLSIGLSYSALRRGRYGWAGIWATGLGYKPQAYLAPLLFLLLWAVLDRGRWRFLSGFGLAALGHWGLAEIFQSGWMLAFIVGLGNYRFIPLEFVSVLDRFWNPYQSLSLALAIGLVVLAVRHRGAEPADTEFNLLLALSFVLGWLALPVVGMSHMVAAPAALILLFPVLQAADGILHRYGLIGIGALYLLGIAVFLYGFNTQYGLHISLTENVYKVGLPLAMLGLALAGLGGCRGRD